MTGPYIPGIVLTTGSFASPLGDCPQPLAPWLESPWLKGRFQLRDWLFAVVLTRRERGDSVFREGAVAVLFDGFLTNLSELRRSFPGDSEAAVVAACYEHYGHKFPVELKGSFVCIVLNSERQEALVINDRLGSRPQFVAEDDSGGLLVGPEVGLLASWPAVDTTINPLGVGEFMTRGAYYSDHTIFKGIRKLPQASILRIRKDGYEELRYWKLTYRMRDTKCSEADLIEECDALIRQATRRLLQSFAKPVIFLSGGVDSRLVLGSLRAEGADSIKAITWGLDRDREDDIQTATALAKRHGISQSFFPIGVDGLPEHAEDAVRQVDGRVDVLDAAGLIHVNRDIGGRFDCYFNGDECFGWRGAARSTAQALDIVGWWNLDEVSRLADWIRPAKRREIHSGISELFEKIVSETGESSPTDLKDQLYYQERLGNLINGQVAGKLAFLEAARPLIDEDVVEFVRTLPPFYRNRKYLLRETLARKHPSLGDIPLPSRGSLPMGEDFASVLPKDKELQNFLAESLFDRLDAGLGELFDVDRVRRCYVALCKGEPLPPIEVGLQHRLPIVWRWMRPPTNRVHPMMAILRLLGLNLYLTQLSTSLPGNPSPQGTDR